MLSTRHSCAILMQIEFSRQIFEKYLKPKFHKNPSSGSRVVQCGQKDRHYEVIFAFRSLPKAAKKWPVSF
jgi:hypothetical protein